MYGAELNVYNFRGLENASIEIGDDCVIGPGCVITGQGGVKIGNNVIIGPKVLILPVDHHYENTQELIRNQGLKLDKITISDNVWIGGGAIILAGTTIGEGAVIAGGAIVNRSIPPRSLAAGNPAQIIKQW
jgi:acetyltransferase-like isoleucine patch superfamily enzyme